MKHVMELIDKKAAEFKRRPLFQLLETQGSRKDVETLVTAITFFVFTFQDILRLNHERISHPELRAIVQQHRREDAGHEVWFLRDAKRLGVDLDIGWLFSKDHRGARDASLELLSEVFRVSDDRIRVAIPLVLEVTGDIFFDHVVHFFDRINVGQDLEYFAKSHWDVERGHEMFEEKQTRLLKSIDLGESRTAALEMTERMFNALTRLVDHVFQKMEQARAAA